jgi:YHS domain-containing protein
MNTNLKNQYVDPVCRMNVANYGMAPTFNFGDKRYYFCAEGCRKAFMKDPKKYLNDKATKKKGLWKQYLDRLNKATGGKPPSCCN